ncbi:uncharacterized protein LOC134786718 [Penaeus indicus]|uniref:uncharacterized protein LOC134786718 n=1 Tax=Penaeus indicus TaxID=29960 RepID=UPI00300C07F2
MNPHIDYRFHSCRCISDNQFYHLISVIIRLELLKVEETDSLYIRNVTVDAPENNCFYRLPGIPGRRRRRPSPAAGPEGPGGPSPPPAGERSPALFGSTFASRTHLEAALRPLQRRTSPASFYNPSLDVSMHWTGLCKRYPPATPGHPLRCVLLTDAAAAPAGSVTSLVAEYWTFWWVSAADFCFLIL